MTAISLGVPEVPVRPIAERRVSRRIQVGPVAVGGGAPVSVQSMTTTRTSDIGATLQQIAELTASGCQIVRVACPTQDDADALRVSLSAPPAEEVKVGIQILESLGLRQRRLEIVSCPSCGRAQVDVYRLADEVTAGLEGMEVPLRVAVMGCVVNGPGEAREADLGVASGNGKGQIFVKGEVVKTVPESKIVETLIEEAMKIAEQMEQDGVAAGEPAVTVS
ncbi:4-hydroxy-3-methylbut-2-en-1-yl diphosphate synthase IspG/GcpE [Streptomyces sp. LBL]|uniref:flavodoxin-dependent (E)-4-hydroxy-3-methylbut-2-enyl-diphosphate synthase n=1 Tax=Streptomyces sp. LBL TaxID=2940562 RepID=UPI0024766416|nr:flavodoxin-dependent (E)-4-hydroxy-3-methylbut-2-enyl-diphosphate synthase [Streptomyces sp. LBL]MDH6626419.1 4-hydroxy-3-methylbut-2-en-1-yl diphosphate synthase IspG/GcpE [Streptomyces sp. LBL]